MPDRGRLDLSNPVDAEHRRRHLTSRPNKIDRDPEIREFVERHIATMTFPALAAAARATFGPDRAPSKTGLWRWWRVNSHRLLEAEGSPQIVGGAGGPPGTGQCANQHQGWPEQHQCCLWCDNPFERRATGGRPQLYCGSTCRKALESAAWRWVIAAVYDGRLPVGELKRQGSG